MKRRGRYAGAEKENGDIRRCEKIVEVCYTADSTFMNYIGLSIPLGRLQEPLGDHLRLKPLINLAFNSVSLPLNPPPEGDFEKTLVPPPTPLIKGGARGLES